MSDPAGFGFTYNPGSNNAGANVDPTQQPSQLFAWQICLARMEEGELEDADNYPNYAINRERITQTLGIGMASGQNAFPLDGQLFVVAVSIQENGEIRLIDSGYPGYNVVAVVIAEQLLKGEDHGMVAQLPNGKLIPFMPPTDTQDL